MAFSTILTRFGAFLRSVPSRLHHGWRMFRALALWLQIVIGVVVIGLLIALVAVATSSKAPAETQTLRTVTLASLSELSGGASGADVVGTVRSITEADLLAESAGTVTSVNAKVGTVVPAGFVIAELENASQRASVLQAQGAYDAALASQAAVSPVDSTSAARNAYQSAFTTLDTALENDVDAFFGIETPYGPRLLISDSDATKLPRERAALKDMMNAWRASLSSADSRNVDDLLTEASDNAHTIQAFVEELAIAANRSDSGATSDQLTLLATARASINGVVTALSAAATTYRSGSTTSTASVDAGVKSALGSLRLAEAALERTRVRAPIAGTVNFMPLHLGDYVTNLMHVATVAQNGALEIVAYVSEEAAASVNVGGTVTVDGTYDGIVTSVAPALDPITKLIEIHVAVNGTTSLVNGQSTHLRLPSATAETATTTPAVEQGPRLLPLTAVKLTSGARILFTVQDGRLVAVPVTIGDVHGDKIEVTTTLSSDTKIVTDARGLSEGQAVTIAQ